MTRRRLACSLAAMLLVQVPAGPSAQGSRRFVTLADASALLRALPDDVPAVLREIPPEQLEAAWSAWVAGRDADVRARLDRGDEDSLVNLWLFGTSFTRAPPVRARDLERAAADSDRVLEERLQDFLRAVARPGANERLQFAREFFARHGVDVATRAGRDAARAQLMDARRRVIAEFERTDQALVAARRTGDQSFEIEAQSTLFQNRGLSSDTSLLVDFAIDRTIATLKAGGVFTAGTVRRVAIIGPGLDFINKADGHDFYPQQTIQPFAVIDTLRRLKLAAPEGLLVTTFDVNTRVNHHLESARERAGKGEPYLLHLPLGRTDSWVPDLVDYWRGFGAAIGSDARPNKMPVEADASIRAVSVDADVIRAVTARDANIVLERVDAGPFDLVVATNVLIYYSRFEQALAAANIARLLRPGGVLISNTEIYTTPPFSPNVGYLMVPYSDRQGDYVLSYQRQ